MGWMRFLSLVCIGSTIALSGTCFAATDPAANEAADLSITYPKDKALFPGNIIPPTVRWEDRSDSSEWLIEIRDKTSQIILSARTADFRWCPSVEEWDRIKNKHRDEQLTLSIRGFPQSSSSTPLSKSIFHSMNVFSLSPITNGTIGVSVVPILNPKSLNQIDALIIISNTLNKIPRLAKKYVLNEFLIINSPKYFCKLTVICLSSTHERIAKSLIVS